MDNLNEHSLSSLYEAFPPAEAFRFARRLEIHCTSKHGSRLNVAEVELAAMAAQRLGAEAHPRFGDDEFGARRMARSAQPVAERR